MGWKKLLRRSTASFGDDQDGVPGFEDSVDVTKFATPYPPPLNEDDKEVKSLGGTTVHQELSAKLSKAPVTNQERIEELTRLNGAYSQQVAFMHHCVYNVLLKLSPRLEEVIGPLSSLADECRETLKSLPRRSSVVNREREQGK